MSFSIISQSYVLWSCLLLDSLKTEKKRYWGFEICFIFLFLIDKWLFRKINGIKYLYTVSCTWKYNSTLILFFISLKVVFFQTPYICFIINFCFLSNVLNLEKISHYTLGDGYNFSYHSSKCQHWHGTSLDLLELILCHL